MSKIQTFTQKRIIQTYLILLHQFSILIYQFLSLERTKKSKTNVNYDTTTKKITINRVKISYINSYSNSFSNLINHSNSFSVYLFTYFLK